MDQTKRFFQDTDYVLSWFGKREREACKAYRRYVEEGISQGRRPELVGGGLVRSSGGWSAVLSMRRTGEEVLTDQRILGRNDFVERVLKESQRQHRSLLSLTQLKNEVGKAQKVIPEESMSYVKSRFGIEIIELAAES